MSADRLPGIVVGMDAPQLPGMDDWEEAVADLLGHRCGS